MTDAGHGALAIRGRLLLGQSLERGTLIVEDGRISLVERVERSDGNLPSRVIDADIVSPGLIDLQVNGAIGHEVGAVPADIEAISRWCLESGITAWLPTVVTADAAAYPPIFRAWSQIDIEAGAVPLGLHLEGPFISVARKGAHQARHIEAANEPLFESWLEPDMIALVTLAPERDDNLSRIRRLVERGIVVSLGHTDATCETFAAGVDAGATKATHLFNAMSPIHHRSPGAMIAGLLDDRITAGIIPDGIHAHPAMLRLALRTKGVDRIVTVSDMMTATGLGPGTYSLGGRDVVVDETTARLPDGTLAGSIITMDEAVRYLVSVAGYDIVGALTTATASPARVLHDSSRGTLRTGARADLALWSTELEVTHTVVAGAIRYTAGA